MAKNIIKLLMTLLGAIILIYGIIDEIDGIGRFAIILFGLSFSLIGSFMSFNRK